MAVATGWTTAQIVTLVATSSVVSALLTQGLAWLREWLGETKQAKFAALYIALALEAYARTCATDIGESETYEASSEAAGAPHGNLTELPDFPEVDWRAFGIKQSEQAMGFRVEIDNERAMIRDLWEHEDEDTVVPVVRELAAKLGLKAFAMSENFRKQRGLTLLDQSGEYSTKNFLDRKHREYVEKRIRDEERRRKSNAELFAEA